MKSILKKQLTYYETNRYGAMTLMMTAQSCLGSIAAMFALKLELTIPLVICAIVTMASNATFIAQSPAKWCLSMFYVSVVTNTTLLISYLFL